ncbi:protein rep [Pseudonocardia sp. ICBG1122]|nr:protein rep [Pseudonocardia pini]
MRLTGPEGSRVAGYAGLASCGSKSCPVCAAKIGSQHAADISHVVNKVHTEGGCAALLTFTLAHRRGQRLSVLWDALTYAWSRVTSGRAYSAEINRYGITGWINAVEVTVGDHGWHPHRHVLVLFDGPLSVEMIESLADHWFGRWQRALTRKGFHAIEHRGLDVRKVAPDGSGALGTYLSKIAHEVSCSPTKRARGTSRTPFQVFADFLATGLVEDYELWTEYEQTAQRRKMLTWAEGTRQRYGMTKEEREEEIARRDMGGEDVLALPAKTWRAIRDESEQLLEAAEHGGVTAAVAWLDSRSLAWSWARPAKPLPPPPGARVAPGSRELLAVGARR